MTTKKIGMVGGNRINRELEGTNHDISLESGIM